MTATVEEKKLLEKWKKRLSLQEWRIKLLTKMEPDKMTGSGASGCTEWTEATKAARIEIIDPDRYGNRVVPFDFEQILVHELLHLKFSFWCQDDKHIGDRAMHQIIDDLARAFVDRER